MASYCIKKSNNGEHKIIEKKLKLNVNRYVGDTSTLYFDVEGQDVPFLMDVNVFLNIINEQIQNGLIETMTYNDGVITITIRDGNIIKDYSYDFNFRDFKDNMNATKLDELKKSIYKLVSLYMENPNSSVSSEQKYIYLIYDILDGDRIPIIKDKAELLRVFEVYNAHKQDILESLLENVIFFDNNDNVVEYRDRLRAKKLNLIRYDVYNQMEMAMFLFAHQNDAIELYQNYMESIYMPRREIVFEEDKNEIENAPEVEGGTIFSFGKDIIEQGLSNLGEFAYKGFSRVLKKKNNN